MRAMRANPFFKAGPHGPDKPPPMREMVSVPRERLERTLGRVAWLVWGRARACASHETGLTWVGVPRLARGVPGEVCAEQVGEGAVRNALARLRTARLVLDVGPGWVLSALGVRRRVFRRRVLGHVEPGAPTVTVPAATAEWLAHAHAWGGSRRGAGRPANNSSRGLTIQGGESQGEFKIGGISMSKSTSERGGSEGTDSLPSGEKGGGAAGDFEPSAGDEVDLAAGHLGPAPVWALAGLPPYPGVSLVRPAQVPPAPTLRVDDGWETHLRWLAAAYEGACASVWGDAAVHTPTRGKARGVPRRVRPTAMVGAPTSPRWDKIRDVCRDAADALMAADLAPAAWALFSATRWRGMREHEGGVRTGEVAPFPPVAWFWSTKRISEDAGAARSYACGGARVPSPSYRALLERYEGLRRDVALGAVPSAQTCERHRLSREEYAAALAAVRVEAAEARAQLRARAMRGEWLGWC